MKRAHVEVYQGKDGWYFRAVGANGEKGTRSEAYTRKASAKRGAQRWHVGLPIVTVGG